MTQGPNDRGLSDGGADRDATLGELTLSRLLLERAVRPARILAAPLANADPVISWCLPFPQALATAERLDQIAVYTPAEELTELTEGGEGPSAAAGDVAARGAAVLIVGGDVDGAGERWLAGLGLPVVVLPASVSYRRISRLIAELALARETHVLRYGLTVHRSLAELLHAGAGLTALCYRLSQLSGCPVAILDPQRRLLAFEERGGRSLSPLAVGRALRDNANDLIPDTPAPGTGASLGTVQFDGFRATCVVSPIVLGGRHDGWVVVIESANPPHPHDLAEHRVVVEQASMIVGTEILRIRSVEQAEERARGDFVHALLHGRFTTPHDLEVRSAHYGVPMKGTYGVVVASGLNDLVTSGSPAAIFQLAKEATRLLRRADRQTLATVVGDVLAIIREVDPPDRNAPADTDGSALAEYATKLQSDLTRRAGTSAIVTYGRLVTGAAQIPQSYRDARIALGLRQLLRIDRVCGFGDLRVYATLADLAVSPQGKAYVSDLLGPLRAGKAGAEDLERVVIEYIEAGGNVNAAARSLHIHRNTMLYKLDRASRVLLVDLRQAEHQFSVWLAYKLAMLAEATETAEVGLTPR